MVFLLIIVIIVLILSIFYLMNSWQQYGTWVWPTIMIVVSVLVTGYAAWNLPFWHQSSNDKATSSVSTSQTTTSSASSSSFSQPGQGGLTGQTSQQSQTTMEQNVLSQMKKNYQSIGGVTFDSDTKTYKILPTDDNTVKALNYIAKNPSKASEAGWSSFTKNLTKTSTQLKKAIGSGYSISIQQPDHDDQAMFTVKDGKTTYDIATQK